MNREQYTRLEQIPNIGPASARDLRLIGVSHPQDLIGQDPYALYEELCRKTQRRLDPCVIDVFISAVRFMQGEPKRPWWAYTSERKHTLAGNKNLDETSITPLDDLCRALPFLTQLPPDLLQSIDTAALYVPSGALTEMRVALEQRLNCYIITYRSVPLGRNGQGKIHLCRVLVPARLTSTQLHELRRGEDACGRDGVVFVAYKKPLRIRESFRKQVLADGNSNAP